MLLFTGFLLLFLTVVLYIVFDRDIFAPPTVVSMGLLFSSLCALYNQKRWALEFSATTTLTIFTGVLSFAFGGILAKVLFDVVRENRFGLCRKVIIPIEPIYIEKTKTILVILFQLITAVMLFRELKRITGESSYLRVVSVYRDLTGYAQDLNNTSLILPWLLRQFLEANFAFGILYTYIIGNNIAAESNSFFNWVPVAFCMCITFMMGYRSDMLRLWIALLVITYIQIKRSNGWRKSKKTKRFTKSMAISVVAIAILFVALRATVGRAETDWDPILYLTHYAGSPVAAFDLFLKNPQTPSTIWGKETFYDLNRLIARWFNKPELRYIFYKEFRTSPSGLIIGNVYTALRPPYYDFGGIKGMAVYMIIFGWFFTIFYSIVRVHKGRGEIDFGLLIYSYIAYTFFMYFYNLYNGFISLGFPKLIIELLLVRWFLTGWHIREAAISVKHFRIHVLPITRQ